MAIIHLTFDIDSDVHPELHAMLSAMASAGARGERLRQLAATGLIWERVRIENPVPLVLHSTATLPAASKADVQQVEMLLRADAEGPAQRIVSAPVASDMVAAAARRRPATARGTAAHHMIEPEVDPLALREFEPEFQVKARDLPELFDVLDLDEYPQPLARVEQRLADAAPHEAAPAVAEPARPSTVKRVPVEVPELVDEVPDSEHMVLHPLVLVAELDKAAARQAPAAAPVRPEHDAPLLRKKSRDLDDTGHRPDNDEAPEPALASPPPRSRLMRMKERGLFKNE